MKRRQYILAPGMTLVELLVAVAILTVMIAGVGFVFSKTSTAVRVTQATIDVNANVRSGLARIREDLRSFSNEGFLCLADATVDGSLDGSLTKSLAPTPSVLAFTAIGRFESQTNPGVTANAAIIIYMPARDRWGGKDILARYVFLLTGDRLSGYAATIAQRVGGTMAPNVDQLDGLAANDCLSSSLSEVRGWIKYDYNSFYYNFISPLINCYPRLDPAPASMDGVTNVWPYLFAGVTAHAMENDRPMAMAFCDGKEADGSPIDPAGGVEWINVSHDEARTFSDGDRGVWPPNSLPAAYDGVVATPIDDGPNDDDLNVIVWDYTCSDERWPQALRLTFELTDGAGRMTIPRSYEVLVTLPR